MSTMNLFLEIMWCLVKPMFFLIIPTILLGEKIMFSKD